jgi:hypothetical protein
MEGLALVYAGESAYNDEIGALSGAELLFRSSIDNEGRTVAYSDPSGYKTVASAFALGGLLDEAWPETRKQILFRILEFFGFLDINLYATARAEPGETVNVLLEGDSGLGYLLMGSLAEGYLDAGGYGTFRLDFSYFFILDQGVIPVTGVVEKALYIPRDPDYLDMEIHLQAVVGEKFTPSQASLTNREILRIQE